MQHPRSFRRLDEFCIRLSVVCPKRARARNTMIIIAQAPQTPPSLSRARWASPAASWARRTRARTRAFFSHCQGPWAMSHARTRVRCRGQPHKCRGARVRTARIQVSGLSRALSRRARHAGARSRSGELTCGTAWYRFVAARSSPRPPLQALDHWACIDQLRIIIIIARTRNEGGSHTAMTMTF